MKKKYFRQITRASRLNGWVLIFWITAWLSIPFSVRAEIVDRIVAQVNEDIITLYDLNQSLAPVIEKVKERGLTPEQQQQMLSRAREDVLMNLIHDRITDQEVKRAEIEAAEGEVDDAVKHVSQLNRLTSQQLAEALAQDGITMEDYRENLKKQLLRSKLINREIKSKVVITENDIKSYYEKNMDKFGGSGAKFHLKTIIKKIPTYPDEKQKQSVLTQMEDILAQLDAGSPFDALAREHSDFLASEGGDLGAFAAEELSPTIRQAIEGLQPGGHTPVMDTDQGYQIFYLQEIRDTSTPTEGVADEIREILYNEIVDQKFQAWVEGLKQRSHIKIME